jgi:hypothetical protein
MQLEEPRKAGVVAILMNGNQKSFEAAVRTADLVAGDGDGGLDLIVLVRRPLLPWAGQPAIGVLPDQVASEIKSSVTCRVEKVFQATATDREVTVIEIGIPISITCLKAGSLAGYETLVIPRPRRAIAFGRLSRLLYRRLFPRGAIRLIEL